MFEKRIKKVCPNGHTFYKSSDCPVCLVCEELRKPSDGFLSIIASPARRALDSKGIKTLKQLSRLTEKELMQLHGMGQSAMKKLRVVLADEGLSFKKD